MSSNKKKTGKQDQKGTSPIYTKDNLIKPAAVAVNIDEDTKKVKNKQLFYIGILSAVFLFTYLYIFDTKADLNGDNFCYYGLGKSFFQYHKYLSLWDPKTLPHNHFPPAYPFILSLLMHISYDPVFLTAINGVFLYISIILLFLFLQKISVKPSLAFIIAAVVIFNATLLKSSTILMSEVTYLLFTLVTIYLLSVIDLSKKIYANGTFYFLVLSLAIAFYVRSQGVSLLFAALVFFLANRKWAYAAASCILPVCLFLPWYFRGKSLGGNSYVSQFLSKNPYQPELGQMSVSDLVTRFFHNVERYIIVEIPNGVLQMSRQYADNYSGTQWLGSLLIIALIIYGLSKIQTKFRLMLLALMAGTFGIAFLWPEQWYGTRFMFNVIPVLLMLFLFGIYHLISLLLNKAGTANFSPYFLLAILLFFMKGVNQLHDYREEEYNPAYANLFKIAEWANQHTPEASLFCCRKPEMFYFFSDRKCANYKYGKEEEVIKDLEDNHINYVVVEQLGYGSTGKYLVPAIRKYPNRFKLLKTLPYPDTYLFEFIALR